MKVKHPEYFEEILITSDTLILRMGKLNLMRGSMSNECKAGIKAGFVSIHPVFSITKFLNWEEWAQSPGRNVGKKQYRNVMWLASPGLDARLGSTVSHCYSS